jgi:hypothetical protein
VSFASWARAASATFVAAFVVVSGCKSDPEPTTGGDYCGTAKTVSESGKCKEPTDCDGTFASEACGTLGKVVSEATLAAARDCLESGVCGPAACLARAQKNVAPTKAHKTLAANFCTFCAPNIEDCESQFFSKTGRLPGRIVLPYSDDVVKAVDDECTGSEGCQAQFSQCVTEVVTRLAEERLDPGAASCVVAGFTQDEGEGKGPGGGAQVATCTAANCQGCCREDKCEEGKSNDTCGAGAAACEICAGVQQCIAGKCKEPCGPNNCKGCCDGDTCVDGNTTDKCAEGGVACTGCTGGLVCSNHQCIDGSCQATCINGCCSATGCQPGTAATACGIGGEACVDCGVGRKCQSAACVIDPNALWDVYISFAVIPDKNKSNAAWDPLEGAPDCYLSTYSSEGSSVHSGTTTVQTDSTVPFWAETPMTSVKSSELLANFSIEIWDDDYDFDDFIGGCKVPLSASTFDGSLQDYTCPATASGVSVKFYYRINPHP